MSDWLAVPPEGLADVEMGGWWMSFVDCDRLDDEGADGVVILPGLLGHIGDAFAELHRIVPLPNLQVIGYPYPAEDLARIPNADRNRPLFVADLARLGENTLTIGEQRRLL